jgi:hypothetical protein
MEGEIRMEKEFNVTGTCNPSRHYMVDITERLEEIKGMIDKGSYFSINRARQYGKTTTLKALCCYLAGDYHMVFIDFQVRMSNAKFRNENIFSIAFAKAFLMRIKAEKQQFTEGMSEALEELKDAVDVKPGELDLVELFQYLSNVCQASDRPIVLIIDEVDQASNNQVFLM